MTQVLQVLQHFSHVMRVNAFSVLIVSVCCPGVFHFQNETIYSYLLGLRGLQTAYHIALSYWKPLYYPVNCH